MNLTLSSMCAPMPAGGPAWPGNGPGDKLPLRLNRRRQAARPRTRGDAAASRKRTLMRDHENFEYRGHLVTIDVRPAQAESDTGVYLTTIAIAVREADGKPGEPAYLCKRAQHVYLEEAAAWEAARARARTYIDGRADPG
jgi:hypothetical protein